VAKNVVLGTAPDSWGIWFADDPHQTPASRFLDEVVQAGHEWIEIGAYGYLSTDPAQLREKLPQNLFAIVEQDMYSCSPDRPLPIARRTYTYLSSCM
jgi:sugar phosphate isomerase/epimerase